MIDPYLKLRPPVPTPADELCKCSPPASVMLQPHLSANPMVCLSCAGEVPPESLPLPPDLAEELGEWTWFYEAIHTLWLDSGEYEDFARIALEDFAAPANQRGYALAQKLNGLVPCHYFLFHDIVETYVAPTSCPNCQGPLGQLMKWLSCPSCRIAI